MKIEVLPVGFLISILAGQSLPDDGEAFDVSSGKYATMYSGSLVPGTLISCQFTVDKAFFGSKWIPSVSIIFKAIDRSDEQAPNIKLIASRSDEDHDWRHELQIVNSDDRLSFITAHTGRSDSVLPMNLMWDDDQFIVFYIGDDVEYMSMVDVTGHSLKRWEVIASGVKGSGDCDSRLVGQDGPD